MIDLEPAETLALARARAPERSRVAAQLIHEAAILIPCAIIVSFAFVWNDRAAMVIGPLLYAGFQMYNSITRQRDLVRLGEVIGRLDTALIAAPPPEVGHSFRAASEINEARQPLPEVRSPTRESSELEGRSDLPPSGTPSVLPLSSRLRSPQTVIDPTPSGVADLFDDAAEESRAAARHLEIASRHFRRGKIPRGCAHAFAAEGNLRRAGDAIATAASVHADRAGFDE